MDSLERELGRVNFSRQDIVSAKNNYPYKPGNEYIYKANNVLDYRDNYKYQDFSNAPAVAPTVAPTPASTSVNTYTCADTRTCADSARSECSEYSKECKQSHKPNSEQEFEIIIEPINNCECDCGHECDNDCDDGKYYIYYSCYDCRDNDNNVKTIIPIYNCDYLCFDGR